MVYSLYETWVETLFFALLIIGLLLSVRIGSAFFAYVVIFLCGLMAGRSFYKRKKGFKFYIYFITIGFLIGYLIGTRYGNKWFMVVLFIVGCIISYYIHKKKIIE